MTSKEQVLKVHPNAYQPFSGRVWTSKVGFIEAGLVPAIHPTETEYYLGDSWEDAARKLPASEEKACKICGTPCYNPLHKVEPAPKDGEKCKRSVCKHCGAKGYFAGIAWFHDEPVRHQFVPWVEPAKVESGDGRSLNEPKPLNGNEEITWDMLWRSRKEWIDYSRATKEASLEGKERLRDLLIEIQDEAYDRVDIDDEGRPNWAMRVHDRIKAAVTGE
jgi:hypothetical protein